MMNFGRSALFCLFVVLTIKSCAGSWDFWPFNINKEIVPSVNVIPERDHTLIHYKYSDRSKIQAYVDSINTFLAPYKNPNANNLYNCKFDNPPPEGLVCDFDLKQLGFCNQYNNYGYLRSSPCLLFTLSQVLNWTPIVLNGSDIQPATNSFSTIPEFLNSSITHAEKENQKFIWLTCEGDNAHDKEFIGSVSYYPHNGFPTYYFPFKGVENYLSPIVAVHIERPTRGVVIKIVCKAWAKNIPLDEEKELGYTTIDLLVD